MKFNFAVFVKNSSQLLSFIEYLHCNHYRFTVHPFDQLVVVLVYEGDEGVVEKAMRVGIIILIPQEAQEVKK